MRHGGLTFRLNDGRVVLGFKDPRGQVRPLKYANDAQARRAAAEMEQWTGHRVGVSHKGGPVRYLIFTSDPVRDNPDLLLLGNPGTTCHYCGVAIRQDEDGDCWENAVPGTSEEGTLSCERNPDWRHYEEDLDEVAPHVPAGGKVPPLQYREANPVGFTPACEEGRHADCAGYYNGMSWQGGVVIPCHCECHHRHRRDNPSLMLLGNPPPSAPSHIRKSWEQFHQKGFAGEPRTIPNIPGAPDDLMELGEFVDFVTTTGKRIKGGPGHHLCYEPSDKSLWIISERRALNTISGVRLKTIAYRTFGKSGKAHAVYEHKFHRPLPRLEAVGPRASLLQGGRYIVNDWIRK